MMEHRPRASQAVTDADREADATAGNRLSCSHCWRRRQRTAREYTMHVGLAFVTEHGPRASEVVTDAHTDAAIIYGWHRLSSELTNCAILTRTESKSGRHQHRHRPPTLLPRPILCSRRGRIPRLPPPLDAPTTTDHS